MTRLAEILLEDADFALRRAAMHAERTGHFVALTPAEMQSMWRTINGRRLAKAEADSTRSSITGY